MLQNDPETNLKRGLGLKGIASNAKQMQEEGQNPLEIKKYIMEKRQELAEDAPDKEKQEKAMQVAAKYQQIV